MKILYKGETYDADDYGDFCRLGNEICGVPHFYNSKNFRVKIKLPDMTPAECEEVAKKALAALKAAFCEDAEYFHFDDAIADAANSLEAVK